MGSIILLSFYGEEKMIVNEDFEDFMCNCEHELAIQYLEEKGLLSDFMDWAYQIYLPSED